MAKRKMPERYKTGAKKGQFKPKAARSTPKKRSAPAAKKKAAARRPAARRNPRAPDIFVMLKDGTVAAAQVLTGKALTRTVPDMVNLPRAGNTGLAVQVGIALLLGYGASMFFARQSAAAIMAGGLTAPLETLLVANDVPWIGQALAPTAGQAAVNGYSMGRYSEGGPRIGRYPKIAEVAGIPNNPEAGEYVDHHHS